MKKYSSFSKLCSGYSDIDGLGFDIVELYALLRRYVSRLDELGIKAVRIKKKIK